MVINVYRTLYPAINPQMCNIECEWMSEELISNINSKLEEVCNENLGMGVLFYCCQTIADIVSINLRDLTELCIDDTPYRVKNNMKSIELLRRVADSSARSADFHFQSGCYDCEVCFENKTAKQCLQFRPCEHVFCKDCVASYFFEILRNQEIRPLGCLATGSNTTAPQQVILDIIGETEYERYERILLEQALAVMDDVVPCPRKVCQKPVLVSERTRNLASCGMCGYSFCVLCFRAYHGLEGCHFKTVDKQRLIAKWNSADETERSQMARRFGGMNNLQKVVDAILNEGWIEGNSKPCPRCRVRIEKTGGCNKMQCSKCDAMFCWLCYRVLDKENPYGHYNLEDNNCANRLFEGIAESDDEDDEDYVIPWGNELEEESGSDVSL
ncbi:hypothetical protein KIN20_035376 [Parelaphostrongylus tenuis]|uniref:RBR-type E3 ubiquitin transferase n=1 Tax=Parelaphostrongylus tenuis TaxID=148309 RepID=A0AAD5RB16_PARTN|nr:hypothetical protein KIN20_035376 [Parelaphostrongylus tenuis]